MYPQHIFSWINRRWFGEANVSCILRHRGVQLRLAFSWARPDILAAGKGRGGERFYFFCFFTFIHFPPSTLSLFFIFSTLSSICLLPFSRRPHKITPRVEVSLNLNTINQSLSNKTHTFSMCPQHIISRRVKTNVYLDTPRMSSY